MLDSDEEEFFTLIPKDIDAALEENIVHQ